MKSNVKYKTCAIKMASGLTKLRQGILVSSAAVLIFLSVSTLAAGDIEARRCYWCGPLAEQVHRSQRAPSCDIFHLDHQTVCDKGYTHCAIVATSPPYAESRLCVKFYQDECYSLYCNSTKTWRMVCACRGDLCNGPHTDRETKAFASLPKTLDKTNRRNKRSLISGFISVKTKTPAENNTIIIINKETGDNETINSLQNDQPVEEQTLTSNVTAMNDMPKDIEENIIIEHGTVKDMGGIHTSLNKAENNNENMHSAPPKTADKEDKHEKVNMNKQITDNVGITAVVTEDKHVEHVNMGKHMTDDLDTAAPDDKDVENANKVKEIANNLGTVASGTENKNLENAMMDKPTAVPETKFKETPVTAMKPISIEMEVAVVNSTPGKLPPAEALQQNITPTKAMEQTTMATVVMNTEHSGSVETTTASMMNGTNNEKDLLKNTGAQNSAPMTIMIVSFLAHISCI